MVSIFIKVSMIAIKQPPKEKSWNNLRNVDGLTDPEMIQNAKLEWQYGMARHVTDTPFYLINQITISEENLKSFD